MDIFPISLKLQQQHCLIVGGGHIALRKANLLAKAGAVIDIIAPAIEEQLLQLVKTTGGEYFAESFAEKILNTPYRLVIAATNDAQVNKAVLNNVKRVIYWSIVLMIFHIVALWFQLLLIVLR